ncbi:MAG: hypothetical protein Q8L41_12170 [Anaerolineales bacterium]|nr:hypothetical protein [Anaerolineales bacterium]
MKNAPAVCSAGAFYIFFFSRTNAFLLTFTSTWLQQPLCVEYPPRVATHHQPLGTIISPLAKKTDLFFGVIIQENENKC